LKVNNTEAVYALLFIALSYLCGTQFIDTGYISFFIAQMAFMIVGVIRAANIVEK